MHEIKGNLITLAQEGSFDIIAHGCNCSSQIPQLDYEALTLVMRKINHNFPAKSIGLPIIGCGLAGGDWSTVEKIIERELKDMIVTIVKL